MSETHTISQRLVSQAQDMQPETVQLRRQIHQHPELGNDLPRTKAAVLEAIADLNLEIAHSHSTSGLVATLRGAGGPGRTIVLRGDMDALPMPEDTGLEFASRVENTMHACGHDAHTAMLASAARLLHRHREQLHGTVKFMFQPGEEGPGGAEPMLSEGACRPGPVLAAADTVRIRIIGKGGHGSMPHDALDPVPVACELVQAFQTFITRRMKPFDPVVLTVGRIQAGTVHNVIPECAHLDVTVRTFSNESRQVARAGIHRLSESIAAAHEMRAEVSIEEGYPATFNDDGFTALVAGTARETFGEHRYLDMAEPLMGSEDFSYVLQRYPGAFAFIGVSPCKDTPHAAPPCHSNRMLLDEDALATGVAMHASIACRYLARP